MTVDAGNYYLIFLGIVVLFIIPVWRITSKIGYPGFLSLLLLIPLANFIFLYFLAFSNWPNLPDNQKPSS